MCVQHTIVALSAVKRGRNYWAVIREAIQGSQQDFTEGSLGRAIMLLAIPMVLEMVMESLFGVVNVFFVAGLGSDAVSAVGMTESILTILFRIIMPLSLPAIVVSGIFAFLLAWNDVLFASVLTRPDTQTAAVALQTFGATQEGGAIPVYSQIMAASVVCAAPVVLLYVVFQRYLIGGLTAGGVK